MSHAHFILLQIDRDRVWYLERNIFQDNMSVMSPDLFFLFNYVIEQPNNTPYLCISRYFDVVHRLSGAYSNKNTCLLHLPASISFISEASVTFGLPLP
jgi:hypothetical protein